VLSSLADRPNASTIHRGTLTLPRASERLYEQAKNFLCRDPSERTLFARLEGARGRHFTLTVNRRNDDHFDPNTDTIAWDPYSALRTSSGGRQSPALGLGHEIDHAVESRAAEQRLSHWRVAGYDNAEERRVICGSERHAAATLGESARSDHSGTCYRVSSPIRILA
jgi:hypothetical protein